jgi:hypothetical protein
MFSLRLGPTPPPVKWVSGFEAEHSLPSGSVVKNKWNYTSTPPYIFMVWYLVKYRDNFTLLWLEIL